jgi:hypothetical protein
MFWNLILSVLLGLIGWVLHEKTGELKRVTILLNRTREEMAKEYVTKVDAHADINRVHRPTRPTRRKTRPVNATSPKELILCSEKKL